MRRDLEDFHQRDRVMFQVLPGRALPLVMTMLPPGEKAMSSAGSRTSLTAMLGDALAEQPAAESRRRFRRPMPMGRYVELRRRSGCSRATGPPMAVPIYDAARDAGTLVVNNLTPARRERSITCGSPRSRRTKPVYLGSLPESSALGADSFDFSLGSSMILPAGFLLTMDRPNAPAIPTEANTVLQGPPAPHGEFSGENADPPDAAADARVRECVGNGFDARLIDQPALVNIRLEARRAEFPVALQPAQNHPQDGEGGVAEVAIVAVAMDAFLKIGLGDAL